MGAKLRLWRMPELQDVTDMAAEPFNTCCDSFTPTPDGMCVEENLQSTYLLFFFKFTMETKLPSACVFKPFCPHIQELPSTYYVCSSPYIHIVYVYLRPTFFFRDLAVCQIQVNLPITEHQCNARTEVIALQSTNHHGKALHSIILH